MAGFGVQEDEAGIITGAWEPRLRVDEELEFFTELALHETERWIQAVHSVDGSKAGKKSSKIQEAVTRKKFSHPDDPRKSLENGILLCELLNCLKPGSIKKINRLPTPIAFLDNLHVFLEACRKHVGLRDSQLFDACDLEDLSTRAISDSEDQLKYETDRRLRNVAITIFWLGKAARKFYDGPHLDLTAFSDLVNRQVAPDEATPPDNSHFRQESSSDSATESQASEPVGVLPEVAQDVLQRQPEVASPEQEVAVVVPETEVVGLTGRGQHERQVSADSVDYSSAYGSYRSSEHKSSSQASSLHLEEEGSGSPHHPDTRDSSYDSLISEEPVYGAAVREEDYPSSGAGGGGGSGKFGATAVSAQVDDRRSHPPSETTSVMPVRYDDERRHSSYVRPADLRYSATLDDVYDHAADEHDEESTTSAAATSRRNTEQYRSTPSLLNHDGAGANYYDRNYNRFGGSQEAISIRSESVDSLDNSSRRSDHSRQSSGSGASSTGPLQYRRVSTTAAKPPANALQFVAVVKENPLVEKAKEVVEVMEKQKKEKKMIQTGEDDWQSVTTQKAAVPEDDSGDWVSNLSAWKNKMRKKSSTAYVHAIEADEVSKEKEEEQKGGSRRNKTFKEMMAEKERRKSSSFNIYPYGEDADGDGEAAVKVETVKAVRPVSTASDQDVDEFGFIRAKRQEATKEDKLSKLRGASNQDIKPKQDDKFSKWKTLEKEQQKQEQPQQNSKSDGSKLRKWQSQDSKSFDKSDKFSHWQNQESKSFDNNNKLDDKKVSKWKSQESVICESEDRFSKWRQREKVGEADFKRDSSPAFKTEIPKEDRFSRWRQAEVEEVFKPEVPRNTRAAPRQEVKEEIAPWARSPEPERKTYGSKLRQNHDDDHDDNTDFNRSSNNVQKSWLSPAEPDRLQTSRTEQVNYSRKENSWSAHETRDSNNVSARAEPEPAADVDTATPSSRRWEQRAAERAAKRRQGTVDQPASSFHDNNLHTEEVTAERSSSPHYEQVKSEVPRVRQDENKGTYVEKSVRINARPERSNGFGFTIKGGKEDGTAITVEKVSIGSPADVCELLAGDEIVSINGVEASRHYKESVMHVIEQAVQSGQLDLRIRRYLSTAADDDELDEDESFDSSREQMMSNNAQPSHVQESFQEDPDELEAGEEGQFAREEADGEGKEDEPPPIPSEPPPAPNWNTFPTSGPPADDFDDVLPEQTRDLEVAPPSGTQQNKPKSAALEQLEASRRIKVDALRRRSEYLQVSMEDMEEYGKLQDEVKQEAERIAEREAGERRLAEQGRQRRSIVEERDRHDENALWGQIERTKSGTFSGENDLKPTDLLWRHIESTPANKTNASSTTAFGTGTYGYKPEYDLEQAERQIIENLEREEQAKATPTPPWRDADKANGGMKPWKSSDKVSSAERTMTSGYGMNDLEARTMKDMESTLESRPTDEKPIRSSMRFFDFEADQKRMEEWGMENERRIKPEERPTYKVETQINLQEQFERDQEEMRLRYEQDKRQTDAIHEQKRQKEDILLEKEREHQRQLEVMRLQQEEERQRRRAQEEVRRRREEQEAEERRRRDEAEQERVRQVEAEKERERQRESQREAAEREAAKQRELEAEQERLKEEAELQKKLQRQKIQVDRQQVSTQKPHGEYTFTFSVNNQQSPGETRKAPWQRDSSQERRRKAEEEERMVAQQERVRQLDTERRQREEREQLMRERDQQLYAMEERIKREAEELKAHRARTLHHQQQKQQPPAAPDGWSADSRSYRQGASPPDLNPGYPYRPTEAPVSQLSQYTKPLQVDVDRQGGGYGDTKKNPSSSTTNINNNIVADDYSRPQMEPGYGYQELTYALKGVRDPHSSPTRKADEGGPSFKVEIGSSDPSRRVVVDPQSISPQRGEQGYYQHQQQQQQQQQPQPYMPRSTSESALKMGGGSYAPRKSSSPPSTSSSVAPEVVSRREVMEKRPSGGYSPEGGRYGLPQTARSMDEITVKRPTIDWNRKPSHQQQHQQQPHPQHQHHHSLEEATPVHNLQRYSLSSDGAGLTQRQVKLNQRTTSVPRPDDYWMRESNAAPPPSRGGSREQEQLSSNRKSWQEDSQDSAYRSRSDSNSSSSRRSLHSLSATPKQKIISGQDWILTDEEKRRQERGSRGSQGSAAPPAPGSSRHSDIMRQHVPNTSDHWLVEEAERRRRAERGGQERPAQSMPAGSHPSSPSPGGRSGYWMGEDETSSSSPPSHTAHRAGGYPHDTDYPRSAPTGDYRSPTHIMEHTEVPGGTDRSRHSRPIPDEIKQTLIQRVSNNPKHASTSSSSLPPAASSPGRPAGGGGGGGPHSPCYPPYTGNHQYHSVTPSSQYPTYQDDRYTPTPTYSHPHPASSYQDVNANMQAPVKPPRVATTVASPVGGVSGHHTHAEVVSVSGHQKCAHCEDELGHGAAMIIESLNLYYHVQCFRCCVCHAALGTGHNGADVRVRLNKLHCQNCYSNDEGISFLGTF